MKTKIIILISVFLFNIGTILSQEMKKDIDTLILRQIVIEGESNVNDFVFYYSNNEQHAAKLTIKKMDENSIYNFSIPVNSFESKNPQMTLDFYKMMKIKQFPFVEVKLDKNQIIELIENCNKRMKVQMEILLAGVPKKVNYNYSISKLKDGRFFLNGFTMLSLSDFNLSPPSYLFGLVKLRDCIIVKFDILLQSKTFKINSCEN